MEMFIYISVDASKKGKIDETIKEKIDTIKGKKTKYRMNSPSATVSMQTQIEI